MIVREEGRVRVNGPLTLDTVKALYGAGLQAAGGAALEVDLSQVEAVDSAAVSLLLAWLREAQRTNVSLRFSHVPGNLLSLARLYGVAEILGLQGDAALKA